MCSTCGNAAGFSIAAMGSMSTGARRPAEAGRRVHPGVGDDHEDARERAADRHRHAGDQVRPRRDAVPAVEIDAEEDRLGEEREALEREGHADDRRRRSSMKLGQSSPSSKRQHRARDGAHREQDRGALGPALRQLEIDAVAGALPPPLGDAP